MNTRIVYLLIATIFIFSCNQDKSSTPTESQFDVSIRLEKEPGAINPFFAPTSIGRTVYQYIFLPLADFHPETHELYPILIKDIPSGYEGQLNDGRKAIIYDIEFKEDAAWSDGQAITAEDYFFTINMVKHPLSKATRWKPYINNIYDVKIDSKNNKKCSIYCNPDYMLSLEAAVTSYILPSHIYDEKSQIDITENNSDSLQIKLMDKVSASMNARKGIVQAGPYSITDEATDQYIVLTKNENYWGTNYPNNPFLQARPNSLIFKVVPDEITASVMAKDGQLDLIQLKSSDVFIDLRDNDSDKFTFHTPQLMFFYFIMMNNTSPKLTDKNVRRAMAHLMDVDDIIQTLDKGLGVRNSGPFHPTKSYYNESLPLIELNVDKAQNILNDAGWKDTDGDNIRDKIINGQKTKLSIDFYITGSELSKNIALIYQESAAKAGVDINIITKSNRLTQKENIKTLNYDMAAQAQGFDLSPDDPYSSWHTDNAVPGKTNRTAYSNSRSDALIEKIRLTRDIEDRRDSYLKLQEVIYEDQPMIFLYSPLMKFVINKKLSATTTSKRPGYLANTFTLK
jgi:peptide/nickel transport system substrate-binding protein